VNTPAASRPRYPFGRLRTWLLLHLLNQYADALAAQGKTKAENAVLDLMDGIEGWVHKDWTLS